MAENRFFECPSCGSSEDPVEIEEEAADGFYSVTCATCGHPQLVRESLANRIQNEKRGEEGWEY